MKTKLSFLSLLALLLALSACVKEGADVEFQYYSEEGYKEMKKVLNLPELPLEYKNEFPDYYTGFSAPFDKDKATLGRVLFYDKALSADGKISCASCHDQAAGFADNKALSDGVNNKVTTRNSLALGSVFSFQEYYGSMSFNRVPFFWDNRASSVEEQAKQTLANPLEMDMQMHEVASVVNSLPYYKPLFKVAFGSELANETNILEAISVFINSISSFNSKYDDALSSYFNQYGNLEGIETANLSVLTDLENQGKNIYMQNCASCHGTTNGFPGKVMANNGLELDYEDEGMYEISGYNNEKGVFKVPTLRNITLTAPYMHDGRFATIDEVLDHYQSGIKAHQNLDPELRNGYDSQGNPIPKQIDLSGNKREALKAFFKTFDDPVMAKAEKYADPFIK